MKAQLKVREKVLRVTKAPSQKVTAKVPKAKTPKVKTQKEKIPKEKGREQAKEQKGAIRYLKQHHVV